jgi:8-oxo-dGTP diphosphatase
MSLDDLWLLAQRASQQAERSYHALTADREGFVEFDRDRSVSRRRFRTLAERVLATGAPYGAHTVVYRENGDLLLVRHEGVDRWVVPGGGVHDGESYREAAERELREEAGVAADYEGLAMVTDVTFRAGSHEAWGVLPVFAARAADGATPTADDPDGEISDARWFDTLPGDTRDREDLRTWRERALGGDGTGSDDRATGD